MSDEKGAPPARKWYTLSAEETAAELRVEVERGLSPSEAKSRQATYGRNELPVTEGTPLWEMILEQFRDVTVILLIVAAVISIVIGEAKDSIVIFVIVGLNALIGVYQERQAEHALAALSKMQTPIVRARRDGHVLEISAIELVPGDVVLLEAGDSIPADGRIVEANNVKVDESAMTGESVAVDKMTAAMPDEDPPPALADRHNVVYMGTSLTYGRAEMIVTSTGLKTQLGRIAALLQSVERSRTPLQERLERMGFILAGAALTICALVFIAGVLRGEEVNEMFLTSVSLAVAAVPEGLPAVITVALALGANRMIKRNALIRKLPAVETLGSVTTICSDKTGTLTRNEMTVTTILLPDHEPVSVTGIGYEPIGDFKLAESGKLVHLSEDPQLARIVKAAALCTDAYLEYDEETKQWHIVGDTTEGALLVMARKQAWSREALEEQLPRVGEIPFSIEPRVRVEYVTNENLSLGRTTMEFKLPRVGEIPFTSERKSMTTIHKPDKALANLLFDNANYVAFIKGAPDNLLQWASEETVPDGHVLLTDERRNTWKEQIEKLAAQGIRVLGIAYRTFDTVPDDLTPESIERNIILLGLIGIVDPARPEAMRAVAVAQHAGIRPIMITGDHKLTAQAIAQQIGIIQNGADGVALSGAELDQLTPEQLQETVKTVSVYARVSPEHKLRVVEALQKNGHIVAMTGDGVNDAPALKQANIGVAMGITGTDVSKGAADMVLTDDNFASIVSAVEEGRTIYDNIRKFLRYLMGSNMGEILAMFGAIVVGLKLPLVATQILWVNLVTDGLPAIALGFEPSEPGVMDRPPRPPKEGIFARGVGVHVLWVGFWMGMVTLISFIYMLDKYGGEIWDPLDPDLKIARSMAFFVLATTQVFHVTAIHAGHASFFKAPVWRNSILMFAIALTIALQLGAIYLPFMNTLLDTEPLKAGELILAFVLASSILPAVEVEKALWRRREAAQQVDA